jgi:hypothetical protein
VLVVAGLPNHRAEVSRSEQSHPLDELRGMAIPLLGNAEFSANSGLSLVEFDQFLGLSHFSNFVRDVREDDIFGRTDFFIH